MNVFQGQTDQVNKIELPSAIQQVTWSSPAACPGGLVYLFVLTHFVGAGAELKIEISDKSGKKFGNYSTQMGVNLFRGPIRVPQDAKDELYAEVKLPKHGLKQKSEKLIVLPIIQITNAKWDKPEARRGDILKLTADVKNVPDGVEAMIEIWEHDHDGAHDLITKFPVLVKDKKIEAEWEYEYHEDTDDIPTEEELQEYGKHYNPPEYFFRVRVGEVYADSGLVEFKDWIEIELLDHENNPYSNEEYILYFPDGQNKRGRLDVNGKAKEENIPPGRYKVEYPRFEE